MAKQHFYSCVPAKMSLFNKMDSYDTFAYSDGITQEQIEKDFALVYDNKPAKDDAVLIRDGALPTVYCQFTNEQDEVIQSAVSYISKDYTGERSAYMVHSLLLNENEKKKNLESLNGVALNPGVFKTNLKDFDLNSADSKPIVNLPEVSVSSKKPASLEKFVKDYDTGTVKRIIFALISIVCGKTKALYLGFPSPIETFSKDCLDFINGILQIFPYHMRKLMSFVTYVGDTSKFQGFKIKGIREELSAVPTSKGITIKTGIKEFTGVSDEIIAANAVTVDFFYGLLSREDIRKEFVDFCAFAVEKNPLLKKANMKTLEDLIFMFRALSGFFNEAEVIPNDDAVYNFVSVYAKNREALKDNYRARALNCLKRYPETKEPIPKNVFSKISNMYSTEPDASKGIIMEVVLDLIHTDAMRDKLFGFIKLYYESESAETKKEIMQNVCSVYYGGFLQEQIIEFFKNYFENEPESIRELILEKLFLTIRTPKIQVSVINFVDEFYSLLSKSEKEKFYKTAYEMLPEGDKLSRLFADVIDNNIEPEREDEVKIKVVKALEKDEKGDKPKLLKALAVKCGFVEKVIAEKVFNDWGESQTADTYISVLCNKNITQMAQSLKEIWSVCNNLSAKLSEKLLTAVKEKLTNKISFDLFDTVNAIDEILLLQKEIPESKDFCQKVLNDSFLPLLDELLPSAFDIKKNPDGVEKISALAEERDYIKKSSAFVSVDEYNKAVESLNLGKATEIFCHADKIEDAYVRQSAAILFKKQLRAVTSDDMDNALFFVATMVGDTLRANELKVADAVTSLKERTNKQVRAENTNENAEMLSFTADEKAYLCLAEEMLKIYKSDISEETRAAIAEVGGEFERNFASFVQKHGKKAKKSIAEKFDVSNSDKPFTDTILRVQNAKSQSGGLFKKLFKK